MLIYKDFKSNDEFFTDVYKAKLVDDLYYEIDCKMITYKEGDIDDSLIGGNKSQEEPQEDGVDPSMTTGVDLVIQNRLKEVPPFTKDAFKAYVKPFLKLLIAHIQENHKDVDIAAYKVKIQDFYMKKIMKNLKEWQFFVGESEDSEGLVAFMNWREETPYMLFIKHALVEEKQ